MPGERSTAETTAGSGIHQPRAPVTAAQLQAAGIDLARDFPQEAIADLREYPVLSEGGWYIVIKSQRTLQEIARRPWSLLGPVELLSHNLSLD